MKNKLLNNTKLRNIMEKYICVLIILFLILFAFLFSTIHSITNIKNSIKFENESLIAYKNTLKQIEESNNSLEKDNLSWLDFDTWINNCASPSNIIIYKNTNNLKLLSEKPQKELDNISKNFKLIENGIDYSNIIKFVIIDKEKKTFITNNIKDIEIIKKNLSAFSEENGEFYNYINSQGRWYNLSYDSTLAPAKNSNDKYFLYNSRNFVEAYWLPKNYKFTKNDNVIVNNLFNQSKKNWSQKISSTNTSINILKGNLKNKYIFVIIYSIFILILLFIFYFLGKEAFINRLKTSLFYKIKTGISKWFQKESTLFNVNFYTLYAMSLIPLFIFSFYFITSQDHILVTVSLIVFIPIIIIFLLFVFPKMLKSCKYLDEIIDDTNKITSGDIDHIIRETGNENLVNLAHNINKINKGFKVSIEDKIKNEKLKSELVANVSHDLKTPLTSIINYTDILLREDISEEERKDYLNILHKKSLKLNKLINDLFQISKMNSGKVQLTKSNVDVLELLNQSIAEYSDKETYNDKNLNFIIRPFKENINMNLDGNKMSRVFENLITNALKYSLKNTRVYVDIEDMKDGIKICFKNISALPLDFDKKEIFERFTRGDKSRNSNIDGNGLGLAIAKNIVDLHGGKMYVDFDADLFKAIIELKF